MIIYLIRTYLKSNFKFELVDNPFIVTKEILFYFKFEIRFKLIAI